MLASSARSASSNALFSHQVNLPEARTLRVPRLLQAATAVHKAALQRIERLRPSPIAQPVAQHHRRWVRGGGLAEGNTPPANSTGQGARRGAGGAGRRAMKKPTGRSIRSPADSTGGGIERPLAPVNSMGGGCPPPRAGRVRPGQAVPTPVRIVLIPALEAEQADSGTKNARADPRRSARRGRAGIPQWVRQGADRACSLPSTEVVRPQRKRSVYYTVDL